MLEKSGVDPKKVTWIQTGNTALNMLALERGSCRRGGSQPAVHRDHGAQGF